MVLNILKHSTSISTEMEAIVVVSNGDENCNEKLDSDASPPTSQSIMTRKRWRRESTFANTIIASTFSDPMGYVQGSNRLEIRTYKSAIVLISIVIFFSLTQSFRIALKIFEVVSTRNTNTIKTFMTCLARNR